MRPLISVGMPIYNCARFLAGAVGSILCQTHEDWELIVIDDGSTDESTAIINSFRDSRIRLSCDSRNLGLAARLNQAIELARGEFFARMDGDDVAYPDRLERQLARLYAEPGVDLLGTGAVVIDNRADAIGFRSVPECHDEICRRPHDGFPMIHPTYFGRTSWFRRYRYDSRCRRAQDQDLLLRAYRTSRLACLADPLLGYREDRVSWRNVMRSRFHYQRSLWRFAAAERELSLGLRGAAFAAAKSLVTSVACATCAQRRLLVRRSRPLSPEARVRWQDVRRLVAGRVAASDVPGYPETDGSRAGGTT